MVFLGIVMANSLDVFKFMSIITLSHYLSGHNGGQIIASRLQ